MPTPFDSLREFLGITQRRGRPQNSKEFIMDVSEEGYVTGSIDVSQLDEVDPKSDEAKEQLEALKARAQEGQEQADADAQRLAEGAAAQDATGATEVQKDNRDVQGKPAGDDKPADEKQQPAKKAASSPHDKG